MEPASIRTKNPGAMWPGPTATKWGATDFIALNDGTRQGNKIAIFDTYVAGICAQLDLWRTSPKYRNKRFEDAIEVWSGGNEVPSYIAFCKKRVPGLTEGTIMDDAFWNSSSGIDFLKAQAWHEAGKQYPADDADWVEAQRIVFDAAAPASPVVELIAGDPPWLKNARELIGLKEIVGSQHEKKVLEFFAEAGHPEIHDDETAWCAAFANAMLRRAGYAGTGSLAARSFLEWGDKLASPRPGCIVVYKRGNSAWQGHVNFFTRKVGSKIYGIGGNQGNAVSEAGTNESEVLGYRWPSITAAPAAPEKPSEAPAKDAAKDAGKQGVLAMIVAALAAALAWLGEHPVLAIGVTVALVAGGVFAWRYGWPAFKAWRARPAAYHDKLLDGVAERADTVAKAAKSLLPPAGDVWKPPAAKPAATKRRAPRKPAAKPKGKKKPAKRAAKRPAKKSTKRKAA